MSCTTCGSNVPCNCAGNNISCGQNVSYCTQCNGNGCNACSSSNQLSCNNNLVPSSPQPFYSCAEACQENNTQKIIINQFAAALKVVNSWNVPACGLTATLSIPGLTAIVIGSYLWNSTYGYFEVTAFNSGLQQVTVINRCNDDNAPAGTEVPACTEFINIDPPADTADESTPCVAIDFTAPAVSACIDITLTNTNGVTAGDIVQIGSGFYDVSEVKPNNIITICNNGDGITPGTSVIARDANDNYQYCLQIISVSPCTRDPVVVAPLVACNAEGQAAVFSMPEDNWVPAGRPTDGGTNAVKAIPIGIAPVCTQLAAPLTIVAAQASYSLVVDSSALFFIGDVIQIAGYPNSTGQPYTRLTVTAVPDGTHVTATMSPVPGAGSVIPTDTIVCHIGCCESLQNQVNDLTCAQRFRVPIPTQIVTTPVVLGGAEHFFQVLLTGSAITLNIAAFDCLDGPYAAKAYVQVGMVFDYGMAPVDLSEVGALYHEVDVDWLQGSLRQRGKIVHTEVLGDALDGVATPFVDSLMSELISPAPNFPINYFSAYTMAYTTLMPGTTVANLSLTYRTLAGVFEDAGLAYYDQALFLITGWVEIYPVIL